MLATLFFFFFFPVVVRFSGQHFAIAFHFAGWLFLCLSVMGGSTFLSIESKNFEFSIEEGGSFFMLWIVERGRNSLRSDVLMGRESAFRLLFQMEELLSKQSFDHFARTIREGEKVLILQMRSNAHGTFLLFFELLHG